MLDDTHPSPLSKENQNVFRNRGRKRVSRSVYKQSDQGQKLRKAARRKRKGFEDAEQETEGIMYSSGAFDAPVDDHSSGCTPPKEQKHKIPDLNKLKPWLPSRKKGSPRLPDPRKRKFRLPNRKQMIKNVKNRFLLALELLLYCINDIYYTRICFFVFSKACFWLGAVIIPWIL